MPNPYEAPRAPAMAPSQEMVARRDANLALLLGVASIVVCAPVTAPFALWKAHRATRVAPSGTAVLAMVLALFGLLSSAVFWFLAIWQFLSSPSSPRH